MKNHNRILSFLLALVMVLGTLVSCSPATNETSDAPTTKATAKTEDIITASTDEEGVHPLLYKVTDDDGNTIWLFGSIHVGRDEFYPLPDYVMDAFEGSESLAVEFVLETVDRLQRDHGMELDNSVIVHSDQGCHYTSRAFIQKLSDASFVQSMSAKGCCWDNAPQESFFGHMKDEIAAEIAKRKCYKDVVAQVEDWMDYYNNDRYQWGLMKLSPSEFYKYLQTGIYPLSQWKQT